MTTPQRALELAGEIEKSLRYGEFFDDATQDASDLAAILRHYAEIMQAEPVGFYVPDTQCHGFSFERESHWHVPLIIKPWPLK